MLWIHGVFSSFKRLSYIVCHGDSNFPHLISPINAGDQRYDSATFFRLASQCALFHTEGIAYGIKLKLLRIFGSHTFFHKLVPIKYWKRPKIKNKGFYIINNIDYWNHQKKIKTPPIQKWNSVKIPEEFFGYWLSLIFDNSKITLKTEKWLHTWQKWRACPNVLSYHRLQVVQQGKVHQIQVF